MKRRLFNAAAVLSALLGIIAAAAWVHSYTNHGEGWFFEQTTSRRSGGNWHLRFTVLSSARGRLEAAWVTGVYEDTAEGVSKASAERWFLENTAIGMVLQIDDLKERWVAEHLGLGLWVERTDGRRRSDGRRMRNAYQWFMVPHAGVVLLASILPLLWCVRRWRRRGRVTCPACGYDLRGTPGNACPECGAERRGTKHEGKK